VKTVAAGIDFTCALTNAGGVKCWGDDSSGQLGWEGLEPGLDSFSSAPVDVTGLKSGVVDISAGGYHACALMTDGGVACWGIYLWDPISDYQQTAPAPVRVENLSGTMVAIAAGRFHTCALSAEGRVFCWGDNRVGQMGNGTTRWQHSLAVEVSGLEEGAVGLSAGGAHTCVLTSRNEMKCWGWNYFGQLGDGTSMEYQSVPVTVRGLTDAIAAIAPGRRHTCVLTEKGTVYCWGYNQTGQLGDGTEEDRNQPVEVIGL
jgi:alpha-tubulin suppressor-like RCC1 family protein